MRTRSVLLLALVVAIAVAVAACGTGAAGTPAPPPTAAPAPGASSMAAFRELLARDDLTYRSVEAGSFTVDGGPERPIRIQSAVRGRDYHATIAITRVGMEFVTIGPLTWARFGEDAWFEGPRDDEAMSQVLGVWEYLGDLNDLSFEGDAPKHPGDVLFKATKPIPYRNGTAAGGGATADGMITSLYLVLDGATGAPVLIEFNAEAAIPTASGFPDQAFRIKSTITFSDVDGPVDIAPPQ